MLSSISKDTSIHITSGRHGKYLSCKKLWFFALIYFWDILIEKLRMAYARYLSYIFLWN